MSKIDDGSHEGWARHSSITTARSVKACTRI